MNANRDAPLSPQASVRHSARAMSVVALTVDDAATPSEVTAAVGLAVEDVATTLGCYRREFDGGAELIRGARR
jgi:hypothetical protein